MTDKEKQDKIYERNFMNSLDYQVIERHLNNIVATYGREVLVKQIESQLGLVNKTSRTKVQKVG